MKKLLMLPFAAVTAFGVAACNDTSPVAPGDALFELVDDSLRVAAADVNAWVYGSFVIEVPGTGGGAIVSGPANFPGNPKNAGTCDNGLWLNPKGKRTSGTLDTPHPHCVGEGSASVSIVLEPISAKWTTPGGSGNENLFLTEEAADGSVKFVGQGGPNAPGTTTGAGTIEAWAIDAATLGGTNQRVGKITIDLAQYTTSKADLFEEACTLGDDDSVRCLNKLINASYEPLPAPAGVGAAQVLSNGFLYWASAAAPFNYVP